MSRAFANVRRHRGSRICTSPQGCSKVAGAGRSVSERPDIQLYLPAIGMVRAKSGTRPLLTPDPFPGFSPGLSTCRPESRGSVMARSADPSDAPRIVANPAGTEGDVATMLDGVKLLRRLGAQPAWRDVTDAGRSPGPDAAGTGR